MSADESEQKFERRYGTRSEDFDGSAEKTRGGLKKADLMISRTGRIVSRKKSEQARLAYKQYGFQKRAKPEPVKEAKETKKKTRRRRKKKTEE